MPELPEVETTKRGIEPYLLQQRIEGISVRQPKLRWSIPEDIGSRVRGQRIEALSRRGKYILLHMQDSVLMIHLGMSGRLCRVSAKQPIQKHDHVDLHLPDDWVLRYTDPRRFGAILCLDKNELSQHRLLAHLGLEPLSDDFNGRYLQEKFRHRKGPIKALIMDQAIVVGIGNIYATEALFICMIHPKTPASQLTLEQLSLLAETSKQLLEQAIQRGGTSLRDFLSADGKPGYFSQELLAYGRSGHPCPRCQQSLESCRIGQRSSSFCPNCQVMLNH